MNFDLDIVIFLVFLVVNLVLGLSYSKGIKTLKSYAVGDGNFSTATLVSTIVATWVSGSFLFVSLAKIYTEDITTACAYLT